MKRILGVFAVASLLCLAGNGSIAWAETPSKVAADSSDRIPLGTSPVVENERNERVVSDVIHKNETNSIIEPIVIDFSKKHVETEYEPDLPVEGYEYDIPHGYIKYGRNTAGRKIIMIKVDEAERGYVTSIYLADPGIGKVYSVSGTKSTSYKRGTTEFKIILSRMKAYVADAIKASLSKESPRRNVDYRRLLEIQRVLKKMMGSQGRGLPN